MKNLLLKLVRLILNSVNTKDHRTIVESYWNLYLYSIVILYIETRNEGIYF